MSRRRGPRRTRPIWVKKYLNSRKREHRLRVALLSAIKAEGEFRRSLKGRVILVWRSFLDTLGRIRAILTRRQEQKR